METSHIESDHVVSACSRDLKTVNEVLELAKLDKSDLTANVQSLRFSDNLCNDVKLLELDDAVLEDLRVGNRVVIRGLKDDHAVLCTESNTYEIKQADTSNTLLIFPTLDLPNQSETSEQSLITREITAIVRSYYELRPCKPQTKRLTELLSENMYSGRECEGDEDHTGHKYTLDELTDMVQASDAEISAELTKIKACLINGHWRLLHFDFLTEVLNHVITLCEENDWLKNGIVLDACFSELDDLYPREVIQHVINIYSQPSVPSDTSGVVHLDDDKICVFFAEILLRHADKFNLSEFLAVWQQSVPRCMRTDLRQLQGLALVDTKCHPSVVWYYPAERLPVDVEERFTSLFKAKEKWTLEEITPYIRDVTSEKADIGALLTKYCRASTTNGIKMYNSRKPITY